MRISWKFTLAYFIIIALPIIITGIYINISTMKSVNNQSKLLAKQYLIQIREFINQKIDSIERTSISIAYNPQILTYLEEPFQNNLQGYESYVYYFSPLFEGYTVQNRNVFNAVLYVSNMTFPNSWNGIYHLKEVSGSEWCGTLLANDSTVKIWRPSHDSIAERSDMKTEKVFSLCRKLLSFRDKSCVGILEVEISLKNMFEILDSDREIIEYYLVYEENGNIIFENKYDSLPENVKSGIMTAFSVEKNLNEVMTFDSEQLVAASIPLDIIGCYLVGVTPLENLTKGNPDYGTIITGVIIAALFLSGALIHFVSDRLTRRLKTLVKVLKSVRAGNINIKMHTETRDEFGELAESFNLMTERIHELIERVYKAQIMEKESELKALEAQINPHFLYNALSTISWMARRINADNIDNMSCQMSKFYRLVLSKGNSVITVEDEINLLKAYVEIEKIRFDNMFQVEYDLDEAAFRHRMIKIILQPIAENAINHGIAPKDCKGTMVVRLRQDEEYLHFTIIDDGVGMRRETLESINRGEITKRRESGYAIQNVMERIKAVYGEKGSVTIVSRPGIGCSASIVIPKYSMFPNF